jgi:hypothetical protein
MTHLPYLPTQPDPRSELHYNDKMIANICNNQSMMVDDKYKEDRSYNISKFLNALNARPSRIAEATIAVAQPLNYSPSCPQSCAANQSMT